MDVILVKSDGMHVPVPVLVGVSSFRKSDNTVHEQFFVSATVWEIRFLVPLRTRCSRVCGVLSTVSARSWLPNDDDAIYTEPRGR